ncbi:TetR/AcrR family transcriptional regulator [Canibacter zhoujuaniae]|uniref:TetR/AcrR family transcriptional regulator n=1 Tax=Canibacter zhoujuaniae TaxID=2708343 RepID=UPI00141ED36F|nr:TetR/AcrR family transcriptional regulator [Canibacter zhoujuaniae]
MEPLSPLGVPKSKTDAALLIVAAANRLMRADNNAFSATELASAAGVSRRTVFNHFASLDDVKVAVALEHVREFTASFLQSRGESDPTPYASYSEAITDLEALLRSSKLQNLLVTLAQMLDWREGSDRQSNAMFADSVRLLVQEAVHQKFQVVSPSKRLEVIFFAATLHVYLAESALLWLANFRDSPEADAHWQELISVAIDLLRGAFARKSF